MNEQSLWRLQVARKIAEYYAKLPGVEAILAGGSVAHGWADRFSDVEIGIFWKQLPPREVHQSVVQPFGGQDWELDPFEPGDVVQFEEYDAGGLKIDLRHMSLEAVETVLRDVLETFSTADDRQGIVDTLLHGIPLLGNELLASWRKRATDFPEKLSRDLVIAGTDLPPWWSVPMYAERGDVHLVRSACSQATDHLLRILCGLNRRYFPGTKWLRQTLSGFRIQPVNCWGRLQQIFATDPHTAARLMGELLEETFDLVALHQPEIDISAAHIRFRYVRPIIDHPPDGR